MIGVGDENGFVAVSKRISEVAERLLQLESKVSKIASRLEGGDYSE